MYHKKSKSTAKAKCAVCSPSRKKMAVKKPVKPKVRKKK